MKLTGEDHLTINRKEKINGLWQVIGNSAMVEIDYRYKGGPTQTILVKCEYQRCLSGTIKDRTALYILQKAYELGTIKNGDILDVEIASYNTGIAFAAVGKALGHRIRIIMPEWLNEQSKEIIRGFGDEVDMISKKTVGFMTSIRDAKIIEHNDGIFLSRQFQSQYYAEAHEKTTGREIYHQLLLADIKNPYAFIACFETGGTVMGVGKCLGTIFPDIKIHPLKLTESYVTSTHFNIKSHGTHGPTIFDINSLDSVVHVNDRDAILMAQKLNKNLGLYIGIASGANLLGAIKVQQDNGGNKPVITLFIDSNKYFPIDVMCSESVKANYLSPNIELISYSPVKV